MMSTPNEFFTAKTITLSRDKLFSFFVAAGAFGFSLFLLPFGVEGDQFFYRNFYEGSAGLPYGELLEFQQSIIGSIEPLYGVLARLFSPYIGKDEFSAGLNFFLVYQVCLYMRKMRVMWWIILVLIFCNYYSYVLLFSAERLKLSLILFLLFLNSKGWLRAVGFAAAPLAHAQVLILYFVGGVRRGYQSLLDMIMRGTVKKKGMVLTVLATIASLGLLVFLSSHIFDKLSRYQGEGISEIFKSTVFLILALFFAPRKFECLVSFFPIIVIAYFVGDERVNIFAFFLYLCYSLEMRRGANILNYLIFGYFFVQGVSFIENLVRYGSGYV